MDDYTREKLKEELALIDSAKEYIALLQNILLNESVSLPTIIPEKGQLENFKRANLIVTATKLSGAVSC
ncbi:MULTISPECIES: hypothetical protein [Convivina]|uniref:Uncharacterized protein n=2 Tax=Convivina TaxID=1697027 RepID=A0A2U1D5Y7_9LACO|nr:MULTISPECIES: hypothetical protein [Convivina]SDB98067.1 hypothetical protein SAMN05216341_10840 [Leuconostocaceae bacterium R-53105]PVY83088.1 hypothetical protein C7384_10936 [Convivina intestini]CAH1849981.1 hypothetical protein R078138_00042 [Convivina sp. LMG 32447]CAH1856150.1 hypothetical protein LMG032447_01241 [Convivina sp. LMG 32447]CAH1856601.1 hypothetical protein R077811_01289 [Convivina intestini]